MLLPLLLELMDLVFAVAVENSFSDLVNGLSALVNGSFLQVSSYFFQKVFVTKRLIM